jgi:demethylmenaquinone methyltransferase / 2-methoxy-6-polyprenyl-1,4-benzoquinol methylase
VGALPGAELPEGEAKARAVREMFDTIAPRYDLVNRIITFGLDRRWRRTAVSSLSLSPGALVLDVACGTGDLCIELASRGQRAVGVDLSIGMIAHARTAAPLVQTDALRMPFPDAAFDGAVSGFALRNFVALDPLFTELARVVRPGGRISLLDVETPANPVLRAGHSVYFGHVVPRVGSLLSDRDAYRYLPRSVAYLPPAETTLSLLRQAGFADARRRLLSGGITQLITATRSPSGGVT